MRVLESQISFCGIPVESEEGEVWKVIEDFPDYLISSHGRVWSSKTKRLLKQPIHKTGYHTVRLHYRKRSKTCRTHRLIAKAFIPNPEGKPCINHKNGNKLDNSLGNLEWVTYSENTRHAYDTGLKPRKSGLTREMKDEICRLWKTGEFSQKELGEMFGISKALIWYYLKDVDSSRSYSPRKRIPEETKLKIIQLYETKQYSIYKLAKMFNVSKSSVGRYVQKAKA